MQNNFVDVLGVSAGPNCQLIDIRKIRSVSCKVYAVKMTKFPIPWSKCIVLMQGRMSFFAVQSSCRVIRCIRICCLYTGVERLTLRQWGRGPGLTVRYFGIWPQDVCSVPCPPGLQQCSTRKAMLNTAGTSGEWRDIYSDVTSLYGGSQKIVVGG